MERNYKEQAEEILKHNLICPKDMCCTDCIVKNYMNKNGTMKVFRCTSSNSKDIAEEYLKTLKTKESVMNNELAISVLEGEFPQLVYGNDLIVAWSYIKTKLKAYANGITYL